MSQNCQQLSAERECYAGADHWNGLLEKELLLESLLGGVSDEKYSFSQKVRPARCLVDFEHY